MPKCKKFTKEQIKDAIDNSDYTYTSVADYLAMVVSKDGKCDADTAKKYILEYNLESYMRFKTVEVSKDAFCTIRKAIKKGDVKTSKWWLERVLRERFGNEIVIHNENKDPLNINLNGDFLSCKELKDSPMVDVENDETETESNGNN